MSTILVGAASWTDKTLIASGRFYPAKYNSPEARLRYYATQQCLDSERHRGLVNVVVDAPADLPNAIPSVWEVTHPDLAIVRLHGRNHATWNLKGLSSSAERFNYDYTTEELLDIAKRTRELSRQAEIT
jgi:uncharacterized protein YecE (DUF72 family)